MAFKFKVAYADDPKKVQPAIDAGIIDEGDLVIVNDNGRGSMYFITNTKELIGMDASITDADKEDIINETLVKTDERYASMNDIIILDSNFDNGVAATVGSTSDLLSALADETVTSIALAADIVIDSPLSVSNRTLALDLAGHTLSNEEPLWDESAKNWSLISVENATLTLTGNGIVRALANDGYAIDLRDNATLYIEDGSYIGNITSVYLKGENAACYIKDGEFEIQQLNDNGVESPYGLLININNAYRDTAECVITGGTFVGYNPAEPEEGGIQFLPEGYTTQFNSADNSYTVIKED